MKKIGARRLILNALLEGRRLTSYEANVIGKTTEGGRRLRQLCATYPIIKEAIPGEPYKLYYFDPARLEEYRSERKKPFAKKIGGFFENLLDGGMFGGCK
jgi:hypothetical protein